MYRYTSKTSAPGEVVHGNHLFLCFGILVAFISVSPVISRTNLPPTSCLVIFFQHSQLSHCSIPGKSALQSPFPQFTLCRCVPARPLHPSTDSPILSKPLVFTQTFGHRPFSFTAPTTWNELPHRLCHSESSASFQQALKTHLSTF